MHKPKPDTLDAEQHLSLLTMHVVRLLRRELRHEYRSDRQVGVITRYPAPQLLGGVGSPLPDPRAGYILYTNDFWLEAGDTFEQLKSIVIHTSRSTSDVATQTSNAFCAAVQQIVVPRLRAGEFAQEAVALLRQRADVVARSFDFTLSETVYGDATCWAGEVPASTDPKFDRSRRLAAFPATGFTAVQRTVFLSAESLLLRLWAALPQVGGYGQQVMEEGHGVTDEPLPERYAKSSEEAALFAMEHALLSGSAGTTYFSAAPIRGRTEGLVIGYAYMTSRARILHEAAERLSSAARTLTPQIQNLFDQQMLASLSSPALGGVADIGKEVRRFLAPVVGGPVEMRAAGAPTDSTRILTVDTFAGTVEVAVPPAAEVEEIDLQLRALRIATIAARAGANRLIDSAGVVAVHDLAHRLRELQPPQSVLNAAADLQVKEYLWAVRSRLAQFVSMLDIHRVFRDIASDGAMSRWWLDPEFSIGPRPYDAFDGVDWVRMIVDEVCTAVSAACVDVPAPVIDWETYPANLASSSGARRLLDEMRTPPFKASAVSCKLLFVLPIVEMARNAVRYVRDHGGYGVPFRIGCAVRASDWTITTLISNGVAANSARESERIKQLRDVFRALGPSAVRLETEVSGRTYSVSYSINLLELKFKESK